jgi:hypothetical protein
MGKPEIWLIKKTSVQLHFNELLLPGVRVARTLPIIEVSHQIDPGRPGMEETEKN